MAAGNFILLQMGVKYFLSHPQPQVLYDKSYQKSFYKICIYLWRNGDRMDFYVIIVVTPVQYVISEDIRKEGCNVPRVHHIGDKIKNIGHWDIAKMNARCKLSLQKYIDR